MSFAVGDTVWGTLARVFGLLAAVLFIVVFLVGILIKAHPSSSASTPSLSPALRVSEHDVIT